MAESREVRIPEDLELSNADKERIRAELQGETVEKLQGARAELVFSKEQLKVKSKEEVGKAKDLPIEKIKEA